MADEIIARVHVDPDRCQGHMRCVALAEDLFEADELGYAREIGDGTVTGEQFPRAQLAANNCPEYAVTLERE